MVCEKKYVKNPRVGDHQWYISNIDKFKKHYPKYRLTYNTDKILEEIIGEMSKNPK